MTDKEKEAIEIVNQIRIDFFDSKYKEEHSEDELAEKYEALCSVLNLIQTQQEEIKQYEKALHDQILKDYEMELKLKEEIEKKDDVIDVMANFILVLVPNHCYDKKTPAVMDIDWVKEYFINKLEKEK